MCHVVSTGSIVLSKLSSDKGEGKESRLPPEVHSVVGEYLHVSSDKTDVTTLTMVRHSNMLNDKLTRQL